MPDPSADALPHLRWLDEPDLPPGPVLLAAFGGWNDAGAAATQAVAYLAEVWDAEQVDELDPEEYHDFQVNRPVVGTGPDGMREITWPTTSVSLATTPQTGRSVARVMVRVENAPGSLAAVMTAIAVNGGNISNFKLTDRNPIFFEFVVDIEVRDVAHLQNILGALRVSDAVESVDRVREAESVAH